MPSAASSSRAAARSSASSATSSSPSAAAPGSRPAPQIIAELEALRDRKIAIVFIVDDNLIGNKKAIKEVLRDVIAWQEANGYPLTFFTEASIDLADDAELMQLMVDANILAVFVGIESPNEASLRDQEVPERPRGGTMLEKVHRIQEAGMEVWCGMILGFDNDDETIFDAQRRSSPRPGSQCDDRDALGDPQDPAARPPGPRGGSTWPTPEFGTNVIPLRISREELRDGYVRLMAELYEPEAYFDRVDDLYLDGRIVIDRAGRTTAPPTAGRARRHPRYGWNRWASSPAS